MKRFLLLAPVLGALAIAGCGSSSSSSSSSAPSSTSSSPASTSASTTAAPATGGSSGSTVDVVLKNLAFSPKAITAKVGQTVHWTNEDTVDHNVSYVSGPKFTSSANLSNGQSFALKLTQAGVIHYVCTIHPFMTATIDVTK